MNSTAVYDLRVCLLHEPMGLDIPPVFSWKMKSDIIGQKQSAYMISLKKQGSREGEVWNSGKVMSSASAYIECGAPLEAATTYEWTLTVWDKDGVALPEEKATFTTGLLASGWNGAQWITVFDGKEQYQEITKYTVEIPAIIAGMEGNFLVASGDRNGYYRFSIRINDKGVSLIPYKFENNDYYVCKEGGVDYTDLLNIDLATIRDREFLYRFDITPEKISVYINDVLIQNVEITDDMPKPVIGAPGVHIPGGAGRPTMIVGRMTVKETATGRLLYDYDFNKENHFPCGYVENGKVRSSCSGRLFPKAPSFVVRKEFECKKQPVDAKLFVSGLGVFCAYFNGERTYNIVDGEKKYYELTPGNTETTRRRHYFTYDLADVIVKGKNTLAAAVSSGWWSDMVSTCHGNQNGFMAKLIVRYEDGEEQVVVTDSTWRYDVESCPFGYCSIFSGEIYDATKPMDFAFTGYDDSAWTSVKICREFHGEVTSGIKGAVYNRTDLEHQPVGATIYDGTHGETEDEFGTINVIKTYTFDGKSSGFELYPGETAVVDFGYNCAGRETFTVIAEKGTKITVYHGEALNDCNGLKSRWNSGPEGSVWRKNMEDISPAVTEYTCCEGEQYYHPLFSYYGFRYIQITADRHVTFKKLTYQVLSSVINDSGHISTGVEDVNKLIDNARRGLLSNYLSVPTDCPQRAERVGWTADTQVFTKTAAYYTTDTKTFLEKWLVDLRDCQKDDGQYMNGCPRGRCGGSTGTFGWADAGVFVPYYLYKMYGDKNIISECYESMQKYVDGFLASTNKKGANIRYGDWLSSMGNDEEMRYLLAVAYYAWVAKYMAEMADIIGRQEDAERYREVYRIEKEYFNEMYVNDDGNLKYMIQVTVLTALHLDLIDDKETVKRYVKYLEDSARSGGYKVQTGFLGTAMVLPVLSRFGLTDTAYKMLLCCERPSWLYSITQGATTVWEHWDAYTEQKGYVHSVISLNHYSFGAVVEWIYSYVAGIKPDNAFVKFTVEPEPNRLLGEVSVEYESINGRIASAWKYEGDILSFEIEIPANTTASVKLPCSAESIVSANGGMLTDMKGAADIVNGKDFIRFEAQSGKYVICVKAH